MGDEDRSVTFGRNNPFAPVSNGVTNPMLPRSLGAPGSLGGITRPRGTSEGPSSTFKSRFLPKHKKASTESPERSFSERLGPATSVNRSSSNSSGGSSSYGNGSNGSSSSGYCTYSNENGLLKFTISETVPEDRILEHKRPTSNSDTSESLTLKKSIASTYNTTSSIGDPRFGSEKIFGPSDRFSDRLGNNDSSLSTSKSLRDRFLGPEKTFGPSDRTKALDSDRSLTHQVDRQRRSSSKEPDNLSISIRAFIERTDKQKKEWRAEARERALSVARDNDVYSDFTKPFRTTGVRAQSVARATSVAKDDFSSDYLRPIRGQTFNRASSVARDDFSNEYMRPIQSYNRASSIARDDFSNGYLRPIRGSFYNGQSAARDDLTSDFSSSYSRPFRGQRAQRAAKAASVARDDFSSDFPSDILSFYHKPARGQRATSVALGGDLYDRSYALPPTRSSYQRNGYDDYSIMSPTRGYSVDRDYRDSDFRDQPSYSVSKMAPYASYSRQQEYYTSQPKFMSLEEECNWILSGRAPPPAKDYMMDPQRGGRRHDDNSDEDDTLDDISGDEVTIVLTVDKVVLRLVKLHF